MNRKNFTMLICLVALVLMLYVSTYDQGDLTGMQIGGLEELLIVGTGLLTNDVCTEENGLIDIKTYIFPGSVFKGDEGNDAHLRMFCGNCVDELCEEAGIVDGYYTNTNIHPCQPVGDSC